MEPCRIHIDADTTAIGHAHPPFMADAPKDENERLQDLVSKVALDVELQGLANDDLPPACALILPRVRRSTFTEDTVQHLDIVSCWKGLSNSQALELAMWERLFEACLASQLKQRLQQDFANRLSGYLDSENETLLIPRMVDYLNTEEPLLLNVSMSHLVHDMISQLYSLHRSDTTQRKFTWSLASGCLPDFVYNFVRTQDCFMQTPDGPCVLFELTHSYTDGVLTAIANIQWFLPRVTFSALATSLTKNEVYRITPFWSDATAADSTSGFSSIKDDIQYAVPVSTLPFKWDYARNCFHAPVSLNSKPKDDTAQTTLCAKITTQFHEGVQFERISRYSIKLEIGEEKQSNDDNIYSSSVCGKVDGNPEEADENNVPWLESRLQSLFESHPEAKEEQTNDPVSPWVPSYSNTPLSKLGQPTRTFSSSKEAESSVRRDSKLHLCTDSSDSDATKLDKQPLWAQLRNKSSPTSPGKRKAFDCSASSDTTDFRVGLLRLDHPLNLDPAVDAKRQKLSLPNNMGINMDESASYLPSPDHDDPFDSEFMKPAKSAATWFQHHFTAPPKPSSQFTRPTRFALPKLWTHDATPRRDSLVHARTLRSDSPFHNRPPRSDTPVQELTPPTSASPTGSLSQAQIQLNYHEFAERKRQRDAERQYYKEHVPGFDGVVSPAEVGDCAFERIFLESGSDEGGSEGDLEGQGHRGGCLEEV